jgi:hypothetical protein
MIAEVNLFPQMMMMIDVGFLLTKNVTKNGNIPMGTNISSYLISLVRRTSSGLWIKVEDEGSKEIALKAQQEYAIFTSLKEKCETHHTSQFSTVSDLHDTFSVYKNVSSMFNLQILSFNM